MRAARVLPLALLLAYAVAFAATALGRSLPAFDDHPGQLFRLWHVATLGPAPWAWNPGWWTGYPELQFYPPGFPYAGTLLRALSLGAVSVAGSYQVLVWAAYLAPGVTAFALLARALGSGWLALPGAFVALTFSAGVASGVEGGVHIGMVPARLGWSLLPLLPLATARWMERGRGLPRLVVPLVAALALVHPAHLPAAVVLLLLAAVLGARRRLAEAVMALVLAAGLTGFWTVPLLARLEHARALAWGALSPRTVLQSLADPLVAPLVLLAAAAAVQRWRGRGFESPVERILVWFPWAMVVVVALDAAVLEPLGVRWLPADRVADGAALAFVLAAGLALGRLLERLAGTGTLAAGASVAAVVACIALSLPRATLTLWPRSAEWPSYEATERGLRLPELWSALQAVPPGRILFLRSGVPLVYGTEWYRPHTHVTALAPIFTGRAIVNGTFTHPSPVARHVYLGNPGRGAITGLAERLDGQSLFGLPLERIGAGRLDRLVESVGASALVTLDEDVPRLGALEETPWFERRPAPPPFVIYARRHPTRIPEQVGPGHWRIPPTGTGRPRRWASTFMAYYPLWQAEQAGVPLPTDLGIYGDLEVRLARADAPVELRYAPGPPEKAGVATSAVTLLAWLALFIPRRRSSAGPAATASSATTG